MIVFEITRIQDFLLRVLVSFINHELSKVCEKYFLFRKCMYVVRGNNVTLP